MTATLFLAECHPVLGVRDSTGVTARPPVDDLPDAGRNYFPGEAVYVEAPYVAMVGPLTATPGLTLADVVKAIAG